MLGAFGHREEIGRQEWGRDVRAALDIQQLSSPLHPGGRALNWKKS